MGGCGGLFYLHEKGGADLCCHITHSDGLWSCWSSGAELLTLRGRAFAPMALPGTLAP